MTRMPLPPNPETSGWHWLGNSGHEMAAQWWAGAGLWVFPVAAHVAFASEAAPRRYHYLRECPTPAALAAMERAQRETDDALAAARETIEELRGRITELTIMLDECEARGKVEL